MGLADRATHKPSELSGGQQQRVAIARALVADPTLLVCDEPTGDLDRQTAEEILDLLRTLNREQKKTIIMVTHDPKAAEYASRQVHLDKGALLDATRGARREILPAALGGPVAQAHAHRLHAAVGGHRVPALRHAAGRELPGFRTRSRSTRVNRLYTVSRISFIEPLPMSYLAQIESVPGVDGWRTSTGSAATTRTRRTASSRYPIDPRRTFEVFPDWKVPTEQLEAMKRTRNGAIVGARAREASSAGRSGDRVPLHTSIWTKKDGSVELRLRDRRHLHAARSQHNSSS